MGLPIEQQGLVPVIFFMIGTKWKPLRTLVRCTLCMQVVPHGHRSRVWVWLNWISDHLRVVIRVGLRNSRINELYGSDFYVCIYACMYVRMCIYVYPLVRPFRFLNFSWVPKGHSCLCSNNCHEPPTLPVYLYIFHGQFLMHRAL